MALRWLTIISAPRPIASSSPRNPQYAAPKCHSLHSLRSLRAHLWPNLGQFVLQPKPLILDPRQIFLLFRTHRRHLCQLPPQPRRVVLPRLAFIPIRCNLFPQLLLPLDVFVLRLRRVCSLLRQLCRQIVNCFALILQPRDKAVNLRLVGVESQRVFV